ncbi:interferon-induced protein 44-like [Trichomycterus rosablanca]|uniref:interferon-induced protein 44-like n=1 Tax=Trichomycterus rosablanca TaxID=2290929 RepID=UPI002F3503E1
MGGGSSELPAPPPALLEFDQPWREMHWDNKDTLEQRLRRFRLSRSDVPYIRILIVGPVGAGKSSFIISINNAFQGRITSGALVATTAGTSFTKEYETHYIEGEDGSDLPFIFNDIMGLEDEEGRGAHQQDLVSALKNLVEEGHKKFLKCSLLLNQITPVHWLKMTLERSTPARRSKKSSDVLHLCFFLQMQECSNLVGIPMNHIFPVKNYHEEMDTKNDMDVLILKALDQIVHIANDAQKRRARSNKPE